MITWFRGLKKAAIVINITTLKKRLVFISISLDADTHHMLLNLLAATYTSHPTTKTILQLVKYLHLPITRTSVISELEGHPDFPSLYSL